MTLRSEAHVPKMTNHSSLGTGGTTENGRTRSRHRQVERRNAQATPFSESSANRRLPEGSEVVITLVAQSIDETLVEAAQQRVYESLLRSYDSGQSDTAARHNEHQP